MDEQENGGCCSIEGLVLDRQKTGNELEETKRAKFVRKRAADCHTVTITLPYLWVY